MRAEKREYFSGFFTLYNIPTNLLPVSASLGHLQEGNSTKKNALIICCNRYAIIQGYSK